MIFITYFHISWFSSTKWSTSNSHHPSAVKSLLSFL